LVNKTLISVLLPFYNASRYLDESILSVLNQSFEDFELILLNDGSTDESLEKCYHYKKKDKRVKVVNNIHLGLTKTLNIGIKISTGKFIARQDADDISDIDRFKKQILWFEKSENRVLCGTNAIIKTTRGTLKKNKIISYKHSKILKKFEYTNCIVHSSAMFLKSAAEKVGCYNEDLYYSQDYDLWWKLGRIGELGNISEKLLVLRERTDSISHEKSSLQIEDFIKSSINYFIQRKDIRKIGMDNKYTSLQDIPIVQNHKRILEFLYNDKLIKKVYFKDLTFYQKILSLKFLFLYTRKIAKFFNL